MNANVSPNTNSIYNNSSPLHYPLSKMPRGRKSSIVLDNTLRDRCLRPSHSSEISTAFSAANPHDDKANDDGSANNGTANNGTTPSRPDYFVVPTFHYNPSDECMCRIAEFSALHREAKSKEFKAAWKLWIQLPEIAALLNAESTRLAESGYQGEIQEKLYFSARYYYRKKSLSAKTPPTKTKERKPNEATDTNILEQMNRHILCQIQTNNRIRPAEAYENYKQIYIVENEEKTKKIFKNRVFMIRKKMASS